MYSRALAASLCRVSCLAHSVTPQIDLPEVRRLCGIATCPDCEPTLHRLRRDVDHDDVKAEAIAVRCDVGKGAAVEVLNAAGMVATHLHSDCPFVGRIAHMTPACFPGDRLHLQYAAVVLCGLFVLATACQD